MFKHISLILFVLAFQGLYGQITLNHNVGEDLVDSGMTSCEEEESWGKVFNLADFGVTTNEQFIIRSGQVGISKSHNGAGVGFNVYSVDSNFPETAPVLLGSRLHIMLPKIDTPQIIQFDLEEPVVVPAGVERIMIVIGKSVDSYNPNSAEVIIAGTQEDRGESYYYGCRKYYSYVSTNDLEVPVPNANFFINATGEIFSNYNSGSNTTLSHSVCDNLLKPYTIGCNYGGMSWSREYILSDFGIAANEEFIIHTGQVGLQGVGVRGVTVQFRIYKIDDNFPDSFSDTDLIGSSQVVPVPYFVSNAQLPKIVHVDFDEPVVVPAGVEKILVEVYNGGDYAFPAATAQDSGISWFRSYSGGCRPFMEFVDIVDLGWPDTKLYLNVTGKVTNISGSFQMNITNICSEFLKEFSLTNISGIASVLWNFGDPASGADNTSADLSPFHDFSADGTYTITATVKGKDGKVEVLKEIIDVKEPPKAYGINNIEACEDASGSGISAFNTSHINSRVLGNQTDKVVTYIDGSGKEYDLFPNPFINTVKNRETIRVRVARKDELCCYSETSFDLIVNSLPDLSNIEDIIACDIDNDGFTSFSLIPIHTDLSEENTSIDFYFEDGQQISNSQLDKVLNKIKDQETITVRATNTATTCYNETEFKIVVTLAPTANALTDITGCDDNNDGISEYFNTSNIESEVLGNQTGMEVSYYDESGNQLPGPLPNPYTNTKAIREIITVRVKNPQTGCYSETPLNLTTSSQPLVNQPATIYTCETGEGIGSFNTLLIKDQLIGDQPGLLISYYDENGSELTNFSSSAFTNTVPYEQQIRARVEDPNNTACATEVVFKLATTSIPEIELEESYEICALGESLALKANPASIGWTWFGPEGNIISEESSVTISAKGIYGLSVLEEKNGIICENYKEFELIHSEAPVIRDILFRNFSDDSTIEVIATGDGIFEYSIDGTNFQISNIFPNVPGGTYNVTVRDRNGCGEISQIINFLNYPRFFTPNNDGHHDSWHIKGLANNNQVLISIYDRYGKLLKQLSTISAGWDGTYNGLNMPSDDYWFHVNFEDGTIYSNHFSLMR